MWDIIQSAYILRLSAEFNKTFSSKQISKDLMQLLSFLLNVSIPDSTIPWRKTP